MVVHMANNKNYLNTRKCYYALISDFRNSKDSCKYFPKYLSVNSFLDCIRFMNLINLYILGLL